MYFFIFFVIKGRWDIIFVVEFILVKGVLMILVNKLLFLCIIKG